MQHDENDVIKRLSKIYGESYPIEYDQSASIANILIRSSLFGIVKKGKGVKVESHVIPIQGDETLTYTGPLLTQTDLDVFLILKKTFVNNEEQSVNIATKELLKKMGMSYGRGNKIWLKKKIEALNNARIEYRRQIKDDYNDHISNEGFSGTLIEGLSWTDGFNEVSYNLHKDLRRLFSGNRFTYLDLEVRKQLNDTAKWLYNFHESHKDYLPMHIDKYRALMGSTASPKNFRETLKNGYDQLQKEKMIECYTISRKGVVTPFAKTDLPKLPS